LKTRSAINFQDDSSQFDGTAKKNVESKLGINKNSLLIRYKDHEGKNKQISPPGVDLTPPGILEAQNVAAKVSSKLRAREYTNEWLEVSVKRTIDKAVKIVLTAGNVRDEFPDLWRKNRSGDKESTNRQKEHTLVNYINTLAKLFKDAGIKDSHEFTASTITRLLDLHPEGTDKRFRAKETLSVVSNIFGIKYDFKGIGKRPKPAVRIPSSDLEVVRITVSISSKILPFQ
jgi:hypothetical protein